MRVFLLLWALVASACAESDTQYVKSVKGGGNSYQDKFTEYWSRFNNNTQRVENQHHEETETGVCYIEVPTINLVQDPSNVPTGNGSRSDLSRIRSCCAGYTKNRHNPMVCDPVCSRDCINALCVAPETCKCYPDYIKNKGGFCIPTCPIACQNGYCSGGECICNNGYELDRDGKYCMPTCRDGCGASGNCTAPNTCSCKSGFKSTPEGSCKPESPQCDNCDFGQCIGHQHCRCYPGYINDSHGKCTPHCSNPCSSGSSCVAPNVCSTTGNETGPHFVVTPITTRPLYPASQVTNTPRNDPDSTSNYPQSNGFYPNGTRRDRPDPSQYPQPHYGSYPVSPRPGESSQTYSNTPRGEYRPHSNQIPQSNYYGNIYPALQNRNESGYSNRNRGDIEIQTNQDTQSHYIPNIEPQRPGEQYPGTSSNNSPYNPSQGPPHNSGNQISNNTSNYPNYRPSYPGQYRPPQQYPYQGYDSSLYPGNQQYTPHGNYHQNQGTYPNNQNNGYYYANYPNSSDRTIEVFNQVSNESRSQNQSNSFYSRENGFNSNYPYEGQQTHGSVPECSVPCINGHCTEGNECVCNQGYIPDEVERNKCLPHCPGGCPNGICSAPRMCLCNVGYYKDTSVKGRQPCVKRIR